MQIAYRIRDGVLTWADRRLGERAAPAPVPAVAKRVPSRASSNPDVPTTAPWLAVRDVSVSFGGNHAVDNASVVVGAGELVGLIGTNGAGKSTLMNAIGGFVPARGTIEVLGRDVSDLPPYRRHRAGLGRGFQAARLYPALTVRETIMVALEARERSWLLPSMTGLPPSPKAERRKRVEAAELVDYLGLARYADEFVSNLSTGTRRIVELGTLLAVDARVLLLDEPTGGVAQREAEAFGPLIVRVQRELGAAMLVIEHDMPLIMSISDRVYCLEAGRVIAEGDPMAIRDDPQVIASYLGTNERAIQRSGAVQTS
jgi:ABC-type branched-subunit amino acid transport system ATPase component